MTFWIIEDGWGPDVCTAILTLVILIRQSLGAYRWIMLRIINPPVGAVDPAGHPDAGIG
jgi:hypothetical protein